jgi:hypothetical protein
METQRESCAALSPPRKRTGRKCHVALAVLVIVIATVTEAGAIGFPRSRIYFGYHGDRETEVEQDTIGLQGREFVMVQDSFRVPESARDAAGATVMPISAVAAPIIADGAIPILLLKFGICDGAISIPAGCGATSHWGWDTAWDDVASGRYDTWIKTQREWVRSLGSDEAVILGFHAEPLKDGKAGKYRAAFAHFAWRVNVEMET